MERGVDPCVGVPVAVFEKEMVDVAVRAEVPDCVAVPVSVPVVDLVGAADGLCVIVPVPVEEIVPVPV